MIPDTILIDLYPPSMVGSCLMIYKLEQLSDQWFQAKLSPSSPPPGNSGLKPPPCIWNSKLCVPPPHAFRIPVQETPLSLGILRCHLCYMVRIFSGITYCEGLLFMVLSIMVKKKLLIRKHTGISRLECKNHPLWPKWPKLIPYLWPKQLKNHTLRGRTYLYSEIDI